MLKNYLKIAFRNLTSRKGYSLLNILGLAIGITCCLLIFQYVSYERSYDTFNKNAKNIVRLRLDKYQQGRLEWKSATIYPAIGPTLKKEFPEVDDFCRLHDAELLLSNQEKDVKLTLHLFPGSTAAVRHHAGGRNHPLPEIPFSGLGRWPGRW